MSLHYKLQDYLAVMSRMGCCSIRRIETDKVSRKAFSMKPESVVPCSPARSFALANN